MVQRSRAPQHDQRDAYLLLRAFLDLQAQRERPPRGGGPSHSITLFCLKVVGDRLFSRYAGQQLIAVDFMPRLVFD